MSEDKPGKPYPEYPLFAHANGQWAKKIAGKMCYFGSWNDYESALARYLSEREELRAGVVPRCRVDETVDAATVSYLCNHFLTAQKDRSNRGEISVRTFGDYLRVCKLLADHFGDKKLASSCGPMDFSSFRRSFPESWGLQSHADVIQRVRTIFQYGLTNEIISELPKFGSDFVKPTATALRKQKQQDVSKRGTMDLTAVQIRSLIAKADSYLKPCILLGINAGYGNTDCAELTKNVVDLESEWLEFPRPKTGVPRRVKLWPETLAALSEYAPLRPSPETDVGEHLFFLTSSGMPLVWHSIKNGKHSQTNNVTTAFSKLLSKLGISRTGVGYYSLRRTFATIASSSRDSVAVDLIMGHLDASVAARYRQWIDDERIEAVCNVVREWLYGK